MTRLETIALKAKDTINNANHSIADAHEQFDGGHISKSKRDRQVNDAAIKLSTAINMMGGIVG